MTGELEDSIAFKVYIESFDWEHVWEKAPQMTIEKNGQTYATIEFESHTNFVVRGLNISYNGSYGVPYSGRDLSIWRLEILESDSGRTVVEGVDASGHYVNVVGMEILQWDGSSYVMAATDQWGETVGCRIANKSVRKGKLTGNCVVEIKKEIPTPTCDHFLLALIFVGKHLPWYSLSRGV